MAAGVEDEYYFTPDTHKKVYAGLLEAGIFGPQAVEVVDAIEKQGIFFREKKPKRRGRPPRSMTDVEKLVENNEKLIEATEKTTQVLGDAWSPEGEAPNA